MLKQSSKKWQTNATIGTFYSSQDSIDPKKENKCFRNRWLVCHWQPISLELKLDFVLNDQKSSYSHILLSYTLFLVFHSRTPEESSWMLITHRDLFIALLIILLVRKMIKMTRFYCQSSSKYLNHYLKLKHPTFK